MCKLHVQVEISVDCETDFPDSCLFCQLKESFCIGLKRSLFALPCVTVTKRKLINLHSTGIHFSLDSVTKNAN